jgi:hypothetical protein
VTVLNSCTRFDLFALVFFQMARKRSEVTMRSNHFNSMILGNQIFGQGNVIAVEATHRTTLHTLVTKLARRLSLRWRGLSAMPVAMPAGFLAFGKMTPATCPSYSGSRSQRHQRGMSGVVVDPGTVGVC